MLTNILKGIAKSTGKEEMSPWSTWDEPTCPQELL